MAASAVHDHIQVAELVLAFFLVYSKEASSEVATGVSEVAVEMVEIQESVQGSTGLYHPAHHQTEVASVGHDHSLVKVVA